MWSRLRLVGVSVCLIILVLVSLAYWISIGNHSISRLEPTSFHFFNNAINPKSIYQPDNETYLKVWNNTRNLDEISQFSKLGNYSVLICWNRYSVMSGYSEWFIAASALQPDKNGFIHQISLRLNYENLTLIASYEQKLIYNLTSVENGIKILEDYTSQDISNLWLDYLTEEDYHASYPFLTLLHFPSDAGLTIILNQETGKVMIAAGNAFNGYGALYYPENIPKLGS